MSPSPYLTIEPRTFTRTLAEHLAGCRPGDPRLPLLNGLYSDCSLLDKLRVQVELAEIRRTARIEMLRQGNVVRLPDGCVL